jgi:hypothetical protein
MFVTQVTINREGYYGFGKQDRSKPFTARVSLEGENGSKIELRLDQALSDKIIGIVADEIAAAGKATADALVASAFTVDVPAIEAK